MRNEIEAKTWVNQNGPVDNRAINWLELHKILHVILERPNDLGLLRSVYSYIMDNYRMNFGDHPESLISLLQMHTLSNYHPYEDNNTWLNMSDVNVGLDIPSFNSLDEVTCSIFVQDQESDQEA